MGGVKVKICGLTSLADARAAADAGADFLGFVFAPSPRQVDPQLARGFWPDLPRGVPTVAVFRDQTLAEVERVLRLVRPDFLQFHGSERPAFCRVFEKPVIRALPARVPEDLALAAGFVDIAEYFLVDVPKGDAGPLPAQVAAAAVHLPKPVLLAGGLNPANVRAMVERYRPYGVDVASGVESSPGVKDHALVRAFIQNAKIGLKSLRECHCEQSEAI
ncbi:MAG: phosphoribosylanthranilate isomerase [Candidatus Methylomirabilia bacterium]